MDRIEMTETQVLEALREALQADDAADGFTTRELAELTGWGQGKVRNALRKMRREGTIVPVRVPRETLAGIVQPVPGYRLVQRAA